MPQTPSHPYWKRLGIALAASSFLVFACSLSMQMHLLKEPERLLAVAVGVLVVSCPASALSALLIKRNQLVLVLGAQLMTVVSLALRFGLRA